MSVKIQEIFLPGKDEKKIKMAIFEGTSPDPVEELDDAISQYVGNNNYHEFIDANMNNPWFRVILEDIDNIDYNEVDTEVLRDWRINNILNQSR